MTRFRSIVTGTLELLSRLWHERRAVTVTLLTVTVAASLAMILTGLAEYIVAALALSVLGAALLGVRRDVRRFGSLPSNLRVFGSFAAAFVMMVVSIQVIPYGQPRTYPQGSGEPDWATPETRELMVRACYACHSNEVDYPAYSRVAPFSWTVQGHINSGRRAVNYSDFAADPAEGDATVKVTEDRSMPPSYYTLFGLNDHARLSDAELRVLIEGLKATPGMEP
jgi:hypothetical protein